MPAYTHTESSFHYIAFAGSGQCYFAPPGGHYGHAGIALYDTLPGKVLIRFRVSADTEDRRNHRRQHGGTMSTAVFELERVLAQETDLYRDILSIEEAKQQAILSRNGRDIEAHTAREEKLIGSLTALETQRESLLGTLHRKSGFTPPTLGEVLQKLDGRDADILAARGRELKKTVQAVRSLQETNRRLLQDNIDFFNMMLSGLRGDTGGTFAYTRSGMHANSGCTNLLFNQTI
jgi:flagellar biosynthesis/type III secretory pathway chaperone